MALYRILSFLLCVGVISASYSRLEWSDCGSDPSVTISTIEVSPMPLVLPGPMYITLHAGINRSFRDVDIELSIKRHTFFLDLPIPCILHVGSCTYHMPCTGPSLVDTMVKENWAGVMGSIGRQIKTLKDNVAELNITSCPVTPRTVDLNQYAFQLPAVPSVLSLFAGGDYKSHLVIREKSTGQNLVCLSMGMSVK